MPTLQAQVTVFGPAVYERSTGQPIVETDTFSLSSPTGTYTLNIYNGGGRPGQPSGHRVSSAVIFVNGVRVATPSDLNQQVDFFSQEISLTDPNEVSVELRGKPGGLIVLEIVDSAPANTRPIADAGANQTLAVGEIALLDGSASTDPDGDLLTFSWTLTSAPTGSSAVLADPDTVSPTLLLDVAGTFTATLVVNDGLEDSAPANVTISTLNSAPIADAGPGQSVQVGDTVTLDGGSSSDPDGDILSFNWLMVGQPASSTTTLIGFDTVAPTFVADAAGSYVIELIVNDGALSSVADTVTVTTLNSAPVAHAGSDQTAQLGQTVNLDGSASSDVDGDPLDFAWSFATLPLNSTATLDDPTSVTPAFVVDLAGTYTLALQVNDGQLDSLADTVVISTVNTPPVADAGLDQSVNVGETVQLDGSGSFDVDADPLTFEWSFSVRPTGSGATLSNSLTASPSFTADLAGTYLVSLVINDGTTDSAPDAVSVSTLNNAPVADAGLDQGAYVGTLVSLDAGGSFDADGDPLTYAWSFSVRPTDSTVSLSDPTVANPTFVPDRAGTYIVQLIVNDGALDSAPDSAVITTTNRAPTVTSTPITEGFVGVTYYYDADGSDPDGDLLTYRLNSAPAGMSIDAATGEISWLPGAPGTVTVTVTVSDGDGAQASQTFSLAVPNRAPSFTSTPVTAAVVDQAYTYPALATDPDNDLVTYALAAGPRGMQLNAFDGAIAWVPTAKGHYPITLRAADGQGGLATQHYEVVVPNRAPQITSSPITTGATGAPYTYTVLATDPDQEPLHYTLIDAPLAMSIDANGTIGWLPGTAGTYSVSVRVDDLDGGVAEQSFSITVAEVNQPPAITSMAPEKAALNAVTTYDVVAERCRGGSGVQLPPQRHRSRRRPNHGDAGQRAGRHERGHEPNNRVDAHHRGCRQPRGGGSRHRRARWDLLPILPIECPARGAQHGAGFFH